MCWPFEPASEQAGARDEIWADMAAPKAMDRLLLGDVGTRKTIVAFCALVCAARNAHQAVMVGPTEILVKQYARSLGPPLIDPAYRGACSSQRLQQMRRSAFSKRLQRAGFRSVSAPMPYSSLRTVCRLLVYMLR